MPKITIIAATIIAVVAYNSAIAQLLQDTPIEGSIIQWIVQQTGMAGIAALSLIMLNKVWQARVQAEIENTKEVNAIRADTLTALKEATAAMTMVCTKLEKKG